MTVTPGAQLDPGTFYQLSIGAVKAADGDVLASSTVGFFSVVAPPVTLSTTTKLAGPSSVKVKKALKLTGTVAPSAAPGKVTIMMTRLVKKKWKSAGSATVNVVKGKFSYSPKPAYKGSWRFVATYSGGKIGTTTYKSSHSATKSVTVK